ncbi:beta strand repeat-containing protein [Hyalangium minutum]|uniref:Big-1 domain-containing protein n=1 Tax=Hyalangium minutum TaxID=394096 RepID=A0A085WRL5_9BACT|nr:Ig-like domain-containing protein [Hyalangium minutum]KFE70328.1 hypothetical protein DB31_5370 [Hyalangium minutum]
MSSRPLLSGVYVALTALLVFAAGCHEDPPPPPSEQPDATRSQVQVSRSSNVLANGRDVVTLTVKVVKADGAALAGRTVKLEISGDGAIVAPASGQTNPEGVMTATLVSTQAGLKKVKASVETDGGPVVLTSQPTVEFIEVPAAKLAFLNTSIQGTAGAPLSPAVEVELQDAEGRRVPGSTASVTVALATGPSDTLEGTLTVAAVDGVARFSDLVIQQVGTGYSLRATSGTLTEATSPSFAVTAAQAAVLELTGLPNSLVAGSSAEVQVTLKDALGNVATGYTGTVRFTSTDGAAVLPSDYTFTAADAGQKTFSAVELRTAGSQSLTATDTVTASLTGTQSTTVSPAAATSLSLSAPASATAGSAFSVTVTARDAFSNAATGYTGTVSFSSDDTRAALPGSYTFTAADTGAHTFSVTLGTTGSQPVRVTDGTRNANATVTVTPGAATSLSLAAPLTVMADGPFNVTVTLRDASGNVATGYTGTVSFSSDDTRATLPGSYTFTAADAGAHTFSVILGTAGSQPLRVTDGTRNANATVTVTPATAATLSLSAPASATAGSPFSVTVTMRDTSGNVATGYTGTVHFTSTDGAAVLPADYTFTAADSGQKTFSTVELRTAGAQSLTAADRVTTTLTDTRSTTVSAAAASSLSLSAPASAPSGSAFDVTVTARDAFSNVAAGYTGTVSFSSDDTRAGLPTSYTFTAADAGSHTFSVTLGTAGDQPVRVTDGTRNASATVNVTSGAAATLSLSVPSTATAGSAFSVMVTLRDGAGNVATGYTGTVRFTSTDAAAVLPGDYTFTAGDAGQKTFSTVELRTAGSQSLTATDTVTATMTDTRSTTVSPGAAASLSLSAPASATAGSAFNVTVLARDAFNNVATGYTGAVSFSSDDTRAALPSSYTFTAADAGSHTFSVTLGTVGSQPVRVTDGTRNASATVTVNPGVAASLSLSAPASATAGSAFNVTVTVRDASGNVATGYTGAVSFSSDDTRATLPGSYTFTAADAGSHAFSVTLGTTGSQPVRVTDGTLNASTTVSVTPAAAATLSLSVPASATAGSPFNVTVTLRDSFGNVATGYTGTVHFTSTDGASVLPADSTFTAADAGQKTFSTVELRTAGSQSLTATDTVTATMTDTRSTTVSPGAAASLSLSAPASTTAGSPFAVTVTARDAFNNVATGYTGTVSFSSDDTRATLPGSYTFTAANAGSRAFSVTLGTVGSQPVRVTDGTRNASATVTVTPGAASNLTLSAPASATAGSAFNVTVTARDASGNIATGYNGMVSFTSTDPAAVLPGIYLFTPGDAGVASVSVELRTAGNRTITATDTLDAGLTHTVAVAVSAGAPAQLAFTTQPQSGTVRATLATVRVEIRDAYGNTSTASSPSVTVSLTGGNPASTLSGTRTVSPASGVATFSSLSIDQEGTGFQLVAAATGLTGATSTAFQIVDNLAPAAAVLTATQASSSSIQVSWTAVGDDGTLGTAASHDLRYATAPITNDAQFTAATPVSLAAPQPPGSAESATVTGLNLTSTYYFALKVFDGAGNSSLSNSPGAGGSDPCASVTCTPPATTCSANGRSVVTYTSACVDSGGVGVCQNTPTSTLCASNQTCNAGACVPVTAASQQGQIIISEFSALGAEFIELRNTTATAIDVRGYTLRNIAGQEVDIRAPNDPNGTGSTPVQVPANGVLYGIPNPSSSVPGGVGFIYGAPGTSFALADTGDALALYAAPPAGNLQDLVDFRTFVTNPNTPLTASAFVGFSGSSTQLEPTTSTAAGNDTATNWCVSFYPNGARGSRVTNTAGALNGSCKVAVINEVIIDPPGTDDQKSFVELAGPGGAVIGGAKITDVEGLGGTAGALNADGDLSTGETDGEFTLPAGTRFPADGILLVADANSSVTSTQVVGFTPGVDVLARDMDVENSGGDSIQLVSATGTLLDAVGHDANGATLATNVAYNGLALYETATALTPTTPAGTAAPSLARNTLSTDTDNNRNDFRADPTPTPGSPNDALNLTVSTLFPDDGPATAGASSVLVTGTDISPGFRAAFGANPSQPCTVASPTSATCSVVSNTGNAVARVNVTFSNPASVGTPNFVLPSGFTYTGNENETNSMLEADYCNLQFPASFSVPSNTATPLLYGRIFETSITESMGAPSGILAEVGYGNNGTDPRSTNSWKFFSANYNVQVGNDDEFSGSFTAPTVASNTNFSYTFRFSQDNGLKWTYCDLNGAGSNTGMNFETTQMGVMTVTP